MPIYTRKGDQGQTSLFNKKRVWKSASRVNVYGTVDELNSILGVVVSGFSTHAKKYQKYLCGIINIIQNDLFYICSCLANPGSQVKDVDIDKRVKFFEEEIDRMSKELPELRNFILPGGGKRSAFLHLARTVSRRAERQTVELFRKEKIDEKILIYLNRLSDLFFTMARYANFLEKQKENIWSPRARGVENK